MASCKTMRACCAVVCVLLALSHAAVAAAAYTPTKNPASGQLSPAVLLMGEFDWKLYTGSDGKPWSRCLDMVWRARKYSNGNRLNFVPTHHWLPRDDGLGVASFCYMSTSGQPGDQGTCLAWTAAKMAEFKKSMTLCYTEAFKQGFVTYTRPHLDDGLNRGIWRNSLLFSPTTKYGSCSYADVMTTPLAEAMRDALAAAARIGELYAPPEAARPVVYMALQGEMSATLMRYTSDWMTLAPLVKSTIGSNLADVKVGAGLNFNALDAVEGAATTTAGGFLGGLFGGSAAAANPNAPAIQAANVNSLLSDTLDFLGISAYSPYSGASFSTSEFQNAAFNVGDALSTLANGVSIANLARSGQLELHYSEFGIGGGVDGKQQFAPSADACAKQPWAGLLGAYTTSADPWRTGYLSAFRQSFYSKTMDWLSSPGSGTYVIKEVFVWGMASWDLFGIYPDSSSDAGSFRDLTMVRKVAAHNTAVIAAQVCSFEGAMACSAFAKANAGCLADVSGTACLDRSSSTTKPDVVTESGPAQQPSSPAPSPAVGGSSGGGSSSSSSNSPAPATGSIEMAPGADSAASPSPSATGSGSSSSVVLQAFEGTTKSSTTGIQLVWAVSVLLPVLCSIWLL